MIPILYENNEISFSSNGLGRLRDCISCIVTEERNGIYECDFEYPINGVLFDEIQCGRIIAAEHDFTNDIQPFDIVSYSKPIDGIVTFHAVHISYRQSGITVSGANISSLESAFSLFATGTPSNPFNYRSDFGSDLYFAAADGIPHSVRQMLGGMEGSVLDAYGGEFEFDKFDVTLWRARGETRPVTIRYGVNLLDYNEEGDFSESFNSVVPYWTGVDDNGNSIIVKGNRVDSGVALYNGRTDCVPLDLTDKFETRPTVLQLESSAATYLIENNPELPNQSIEVNFAETHSSNEFGDVSQLLDCRLCDSIRLIFPRYNVEGLFKIVKVVYNVLLEQYDSMELGNLSATLSSALGISQTSTFSGGGGGGGGGSTLPGMIEMYGGLSAPSGWLLCDGSAVSRTSYARLFSVIGTTFGDGDGSTTFNLPDLRDRFPVGIGTDYNLNSKGGSKYIQAHTHNYTEPKASGGSHAHGAGDKLAFMRYNQEAVSSGLNERSVASGASGNYKAPVVNNASVDYSYATRTQYETPSITISGGGIGAVKDISTGNAGNLPPFIGINFIICTGE